jgi:RNA polymerase sigma-70 factor (TIGR02952 family)
MTATRTYADAHTAPDFSDPSLSRDLVKLAQSGDTDAFGMLYDGYMEKIYRYIFFRVTDEQTAEDLTSQVFCKAWENLNRYKSTGAPFGAWLYTIARNAVIDHYRTRKETVSLEEVTSLASDGPAPEDQTELKFELETLNEALQVLTDEQQQVLVLKFIAGMSTDEIADQLGKRAGAIRALQMRGLQALSRVLGEEALASEMLMHA